MQWFSLNRLLYVVPAVIIALTFHEYAHARVSYAFGDPTAKQAGRLSLNPLRHLDPLGAVMMIVAGFGWAKPVPVNPWYYSGSRKRKLLWVSLAGPLMNLLEALAGTALLWLIRSWALHNSAVNSSSVVLYFFRLLQYFVSVNVGLAVFNLIPIPPLDGSKILAGLLPDRCADFIYKLEKNGFVILLILVFLPDVMGIIGLPEVDIIGTVISIPAEWIVRGLFRLFGLA